MFSSNVYRRLCIYEGKDFTQRIIENESVQQTKPNDKTNEKEDSRPLVWYQI